MYQEIKWRSLGLEYWQSDCNKFLIKPNFILHEGCKPLCLYDLYIGGKKVGGTLRLKQAKQVAQGFKDNCL